MDHETLESGLKNRTLEERIQKILSVETEMAVAKGQNFLSLTKRLRMRMVLGDGRVVNRTAILKDSNIESEAHMTFVKELGVFKTEITMYTGILKEMEYLMEEFDWPEDVLWCKLLHYVPYSSILLEDLRANGFRSLLFPCYLDKEHAQLVLRSLGCFHGMGKVLEERGIVKEENFSKWYLFSKTAYKIWHSYIQEFVNIINKNWDPSWKPIAIKLQTLTAKDIEEQLEAIANFEETPFKTLNHGDVMIPNIMFKYDWKNRPVAMRFLDFQLPTFGTPCIDLTHFLNRSLRGSFIKENFIQLMECYYSGLITTLDKFDFKGRKPTLDDLIAEMERMSFMGSILFVVNYGPLPSSEGNFGDDIHKERLLYLFSRPESQEEIGPTIKNFVEKHLS